MSLGFIYVIDAIVWAYVARLEWRAFKRKRGRA